MAFLCGIKREDKRHQEQKALRRRMEYKGNIVTHYCSSTETINNMLKLRGQGDKCDKNEQERRKHQKIILQKANLQEASKKSDSSSQGQLKGKRTFGGDNLRSN